MLETLGLTPDIAALASAGDCRIGRVAHAAGGVARVLTEEGEVRAGCGGGLLARLAGDPAQAPCAGDWVVLRAWPDRRVTVERVVPRRTAVCWPARAAGRPLAGNVELVLLAGMPSHLPRPDTGALPVLVVDEDPARAARRTREVAAPGGTVLLLAATPARRRRGVEVLSGGRLGCLAGAETVLVPLCDGGALVSAVLTSGSRGALPPAGTAVT